MPPSGFAKKETDMLCAFTQNILTRFEEEVADRKFSSFAEGIKSELKIIEKHLSSDISHAERGVLELVKQFYLALQEGKTVDDLCEDISVLSTKYYE